MFTVSGVRAEDASSSRAEFTNLKPLELAVFAEENEVAQGYLLAPLMSRVAARYVAFTKCGEYANDSCCLMIRSK